MIQFEKFTLPNGLRVIVHQDEATPIVAFNLLYNAGARDEHPDKTGFAHLFEHLMFEGSVNIPHFDEPLQKVGGENNAFTNNDITNYYITLPVSNLETAFWLESDRMLGLNLTPKSLDVQRHVVIEEFRQRYLNQPYGDVWLLLRPLVYRVHPYRWPTIGKEIKHIEEATLDDVKEFFDKYYAPNNAILVVAGDVEVDRIKELAENWFGPIPRGPEMERNLPVEPAQTAPRKLEVERDVPADAIYRAYHTGSRKSENYHTVDLISDILARGHSSRLFNSLVKDNPLFSEIDAYVTGDLDPGLFIIAGKVNPGIDINVANKAIDEELERLILEPVSETELQKVKHKAESTLVFSETSVLNKAMNLAFFELLGDAAMINQESEKFIKVTALDIQTAATKIFQPKNSTTLFYKAKKRD